MPSIINSDNGAVSGSAGLKFTASDDGILEIQNNGQTSLSLSESGMRVPVGTTAERPASPQNGTIRYNTDTLELEAYANGVWRSVAGVEPALKLDFDEYQFDGRISFTRATSATFFDRNGVLRTAGSGVARFDHRLENGVWVNKGLLIEEARTNLCKYSEELNVTGGSNWILTNASVATNVTTAPDGVTSADKLVENTSNAEHIISGPNITYSSGTTYTFSAFLKTDGRSLRVLLPAAAFGENKIVWFNLSDGTVTNTSGSGITRSIQDCGNGWYHCSISATATASPTTGVIQLVLVSTGTTTVYTGNGSSGVFIWGAQMEVGAFPTSYIKTTNASATRNTDVASMTGTNFSSWFNASEGTVYWQGDTTGINGRGYGFNSGTDSRMILNISNIDGLTSSFFISDGVTTQVSINSPEPRIPIVLNQAYQAASAYKLNDFAHTLDGRLPTITNSGNLISPNQLEIGFNGNLGYLNGHIAKFYYWPNRLPNAKLQSLTS